jgi:hypothetical protein
MGCNGLLAYAMHDLPRHHQTLHRSAALVAVRCRGPIQNDRVSCSMISSSSRDGACGEKYPEQCTVAFSLPNICLCSVHCIAIDPLSTRALQSWPAETSRTDHSHATGRCDSVPVKPFLGVRVAAHHLHYRSWPCGTLSARSHVYSTVLVDTGAPRPTANGVDLIVHALHSSTCACGAMQPHRRAPICGCPQPIRERVVTYNASRLQTSPQRSSPCQMHGHRREPSSAVRT